MNHDQMMKKEEKIFWLALVAIIYNVLAALICPVLISERSWFDLALGVVFILAAACGIALVLRNL